MASNATALDKIQTQIQWNRLLSVVEEQAQVLVRTAFSTSAREAGDISAGVFDPQGRMLAQAVTGTPGHVNAMAASVGFFLERYSLDGMNDGDVFITNDPWLGTGHLNDFTVVTPTFLDGKPIGLFACTSHVVDVGGRGFGPDGRQVFEEGIRIPIMPLARKGEVDEGVLSIIRTNVRNPVEVEGDLYSLMACNDVGGKRLVDMMREFALTDLDDLGRHIIDTSRAGMLEAFSKLPKGTYRNSMTIDGFESEIDLVAALTVTDDGVEVDFDGTSGTSRYGINVPLTYTQAYASFGVRCVIGGAIPNNAGSLGAIRVTAPLGSILNAPDPSAVAARHVIGQMLPDVVLGCLNQIMPNEVPAEGTSCLYNPVLLGGHGITDEDYGDGTPFAMNTFHAGGTGARPGKDGLDATAFPSGVRNTPVEVNETIAPLVIWRKEYREDSGGAGAYRGGVGQIMTIAHSQGKAFAMNCMFDRVNHPPRGRNGGLDGAAGRIALDSGPLFNGKGRQTIPAGDRVTVFMPGGGGLGDPKQRDPEAVARDVEEGYISPEHAKQVYCWTG